MNGRTLVFIKDGERIFLVSDDFRNLAKDSSVQQLVLMLDQIRRKYLKTKDTFSVEIFIDGYSYSRSGKALILEPIPNERYEILGYLIETTSSEGIIRLMCEKRGDLIGVLYAWNRKEISNDNVYYLLNEDEGVILQWENLSNRALVFIQLTISYY